MMHCCPCRYVFKDGIQQSSRLLKVCTLKMRPKVPDASLLQQTRDLSAEAMRPVLMPLLALTFVFVTMLMSPITGSAQEHPHRDHCRLHDGGRCGSGG